MNLPKLILILSFIVSCGYEKHDKVTDLANGALAADGNDESTYALILQKGYNYETPDRSGAHSDEPYRHIRQSYDEFLKRYVFDFILHIQNDDDRGKANIKDRQRNEIKTDAKSPAEMVAQRGETLQMSWKFCLPEGMKTTTKFSHVHQLKGIDNAAGDADVGMPLVTFTARSMSNGTQQFQVIHTAPSSQGSENTIVYKCPLDAFLGRWVEVVETVTFDEKGTCACAAYQDVAMAGRFGRNETKMGIISSFWRESFECRHASRRVLEIHGFLYHETLTEHTI